MVNLSSHDFDGRHPYRSQFKDVEITYSLGYALKILHLSDSGLPDWRIEKAGFTGLRNGYQVFFAGKSSNNSNSIFTKVFPVEWTSRARRGIPFYWHSVKKQVAKVLKEVNPDIVHAHDIFSSKIASQLDVSMVYDDHEYWSHLVKVKNSYGQKTVGEVKSVIPKLSNKISKIKRSFSDYQLLKTWTNWEKQLVSRYPTIVVSDNIADEMKERYMSRSIFVVPNFPLQSETKSIQTPVFHDKLGSVYAGIDKKNIQQPNRNLSGLIDTFNDNDIGTLTIIGWEREVTGNTKATGILPRCQMFDEMSSHSLGLLPWHKHWSHKFLNPNKAYEYAHAGLFVLCTSSLETVSKTLGEHCKSFEDYGEMVTILSGLKGNLDELYEKRLRIFEYARSNLIWEKYENNILSAYSSTS